MMFISVHLWAKSLDDLYSSISYLFFYKRSSATPRATHGGDAHRDALHDDSDDDDVFDEGYRPAAQRHRTGECLH